MAMRVPTTEYGDLLRQLDSGVTEEEFDKRKDLWEGINGRDRMDTRFENTERTQVLDPRGDQRGRPMPRDAKFRQADNHGEWGNDVYKERLEFGLDGPDSNVAYHGAGLPTRQDLSYPAIGSEKATLKLDTDAQMNPKADGVDGDN